MYSEYQQECNKKAPNRKRADEIKCTLEQPSRTVVHAKLEMTSPDSPEEVEADAVANDIVQGGKIARSIFTGGAGGGMAVSSQMEGRLNSMQGGGQTMPDGLRNMMERGFNRDFSQVRLHTDREAANLSSSIHAKAFTHGNDIYFNQGQFSPNTSEGQKLMAHELTHVVQGGGKVGRSPEEEVALEEGVKYLEEGVKNEIKDICNKVIRKLESINDRFPNPNIRDLIISAYKQYVNPSYKYDKVVTPKLRTFCTVIKTFLENLIKVDKDNPDSRPVLDYLTVKQFAKNKKEIGIDRDVVCETQPGKGQINTINCYIPYTNLKVNKKAFNIIHEFSHMWIEAKDICYWGRDSTEELSCDNNKHKDEDKSIGASAIEFFIRALYLDEFIKKPKTFNLGEKQEADPL